MTAARDPALGHMFCLQLPRRPFGGTVPDCWCYGLLAPGIAAVPTTALLQRYAEVFGGRKRVSRYLSGETSSNVTIPANLYPFCCGGAAGRSGPRTTILHNETAYSKRFSCRPPGYVQAGLPGRFQVRQLERKEEMKPDPSDDERFELSYLKAPR